MILTTTQGQKNLPRCFATVMEMLQRLNCGRLDIRLSDGRAFRVQGDKAGPVAELHVHHRDLFSRLVREGDLGFSDACLEQCWSTPDLQAFMDLVHRGNAAVYDGFPGMGLLRAYEKMRFWLQRNHRAQARRNIAYHYDLGNDFYGIWLTKP
jgi:cyclopropane-fatty-acyl-phospholipid synthase